MALELESQNLLNKDLEEAQERITSVLLIPNDWFSPGVRLTIVWGVLKNLDA